MCHNVEEFRNRRRGEEAQSAAVFACCRGTDKLRKPSGVEGGFGETRGEDSNL